MTDKIENSTQAPAETKTTKLTGAEARKRTEQMSDATKNRGGINANFPAQDMSKDTVDGQPRFPRGSGAMLTR